MVTNTDLHLPPTGAGLRPLDVTRDLGEVAALIEAAFGETLDPQGRAVLREMRQWHSGNWLGWLALRLNTWGFSLPPGFVWIDDRGRVVGNISIRPAELHGGWIIGNVAVAPAHRRRGIARKLMEAALDLVQRREGQWIVLQVDTDNTPAQTLYRTLGFHSLGVTRRWRWTGRQTWPTPAAAAHPEITVRPCAWHDWPQIHALAESALPLAQSHFEPVTEQDFRQDLSLWLMRTLDGLNEAYFAAHTATPWRGVARVRSANWFAGPVLASEARVDLYLAPGADTHVARSLLAHALDHVVRHTSAPVRLDAPHDLPALTEALEQTGWRAIRALETLKCMP